MSEKFELKPCPFCGTDLNRFPDVMTVKASAFRRIFIGKTTSEKNNR